MSFSCKTNDTIRKVPIFNFQTDTSSYNNTDISYFSVSMRHATISSTNHAERPPPQVEVWREVSAYSLAVELTNVVPLGYEMDPDSYSVDSAVRFTLSAEPPAELGETG